MTANAETRKLVWFGCGIVAMALGSAACSAPTDVIAVADTKAEPAIPADPQVGALTQQEGGALGLGRLVIPTAPDGAQPGDAMLIVAGLPVHDWQGPTFPWPLATPLRTFFADPEADRPGPATEQGMLPGSPGNDSHASTAPAPGDVTGSDANGAPARDGGRSSGSYASASGHASSLSRSKPAAAEQEVFQHLSTADLGPWHDVHVVASMGDAAERLRGLFAAVRALPRQDPALVARDDWNDRYLVILEADSCEMASDHHDIVCSDARSSGE